MKKIIFFLALFIASHNIQAQRDTTTPIDESGFGDLPKGDQLGYTLRKWNYEPSYKITFHGQGRRKYLELDFGGDSLKANLLMPADSAANLFIDYVVSQWPYRFDKYKHEIDSLNEIIGKFRQKEYDDMKDYLTRNDVIPYSPVNCEARTWFLGEKSLNYSYALFGDIRVERYHGNRYIVNMRWNGESEVFNQLINNSFYKLTAIGLTSRHKVFFETNLPIEEEDCMIWYIIKNLIKDGY